QETSGIGPFKFRKKNDLVIESFTNIFKNKNYDFKYEPENQERLLYISNSLFHYNLIEKYTVVNHTNKPVNINSQFGQENSSSSGYHNKTKNKEEKQNDKKFLQKSNNRNDNTFNKNKLNSNNLNNNNNNNNNTNKDTLTSKYFKGASSSSSSKINNSKFHSIQNTNNNSSLNSQKGKNVVEDRETINQNKENNDTPPENLFELLKNVKIVISGIQNPERGIIRNLAIEMGAKYEPQWSDSSTHLICPIKGTPKYNEVKEQGRGIIVKPEWIYQCYEKKKRLPEKYYSFEKYISEGSGDGDQSMDKTINKRKFDGDGNANNKEIVKNNILNKKDSTTQDITDDIDNEKSIKLKQINYILNIPDIFNNLYFFFDKTILEKPKNILERYVLGHGGKILKNVNNKVTHYCTMKTSNEVTIPNDIDFKGKIINPSYIINCHNQNCVL
ncbi:hypothetical protein PIROE2DRAFT_4153, partial [Piromyces sp. E2]